MFLQEREECFALGIARKRFPWPRTREAIENPPGSLCYAVGAATTVLVPLTKGKQTSFSTIIEPKGQGIDVDRTIIS
jgi:hypothetical protein